MNLHTFNLTKIICNGLQNGFQKSCPLETLIYTDFEHPIQIWNTLSRFGTSYPDLEHPILIWNIYPDFEQPFRK